MQQANAWANVDPVLCLSMASPRHNELNVGDHVNIPVSNLILLVKNSTFLSALIIRYIMSKDVYWMLFWFIMHTNTLQKQWVKERFY